MDGRKKIVICLFDCFRIQPHFADHYERQNRDTINLNGKLIPMIDVTAGMDSKWWTLGSA